MSRSTSQSSSVAASATTSGLARTLSLKTKPKSSQPPNATAPSAIKLFVTNLRLLDLDRRADWPGITVHTFSSKNADQKQRIGGVEWALFRLFELWDPEETGQKLQPFFPPLEPLQSLNLRAALYRCLSELRKNGVLGRESVLRKTMLDECKGEKFYEILALFSTAVLQKDLPARKHATKTIAVAVARKLATASALPADKQPSLLPLAIAHKAALANVLKRKDQKRTRYTEFNDLLQTKVEEISLRNKQSKATPRSRRPSLPQNEAAALKKQLKDNWVGNQAWLDTLLHGDDVQLEDAFLNRPFNEVWQMVEKGRKLQDASPEAGLLANLQSRVQEQQDRLQVWRNFHAKLRNEDEEVRPNPSSVRAPAKKFIFEHHLKLQLPSSAKVFDHPPASQKSLGPEYKDIISEMESELAEASKPKHNRPAVTRRGSSFSTSPTRQRKSRSDSAPKRPTSSHAEKPTKPAPPSRKQSKEAMLLPPLRREPSATPIDSDATLVGNQPTSRPASSHSPETIRQCRYDRNHQTSDSLPAPSSPPRPTPIIQTAQPLSPSPAPSYFPSEPPILEPPTLSHDDLLAEQILSSVANATPSPVKKQPRLSLLERTRISMAHTTAFHPITESPGLPDSDTTNPLPSLPPPISADLAPLDRRTSLLERTRLSMAAMTSHQNPLAQVRKEKHEKRKSSRQSLYPVNQFDTPRNRKSIQAIEELKSGERTPKEELFSDEVDYERVFKSRPKIAQSPVFSPEMAMAEGLGAEDRRGHGRISQLGIGDGYGRDGDDDEEEYDEGVTGVDLADVDQDEDEDGFTQAWANSPSRRSAWGGGKEMIYNTEPKVLRG
ncbi:HAUS augmin-like complex subunit 6 N-terminus-domain-containing protein [Clohesyomyces aquaticus]|uniref:HAUS augmin-like complex subunit 6 N-terminus-domain-containing protein n=1 Tax=Clohesyomyces aquaticus TaxID=1231657 RepID=A0A1Y1YRS6_9PLEO|nr:HAUS augmin-like complex subunit 6 N-terminus-domain-containing protein [Clohesyomyces aquaticus]